MRAIRQALTVVGNHLGLAGRPRWCTYLVCYRCNARCPMCDSWRLRPGAELTPAQVDAVFAKVGGLDVVRLTGGEPFLRDDFLDLATVVLRRSSPLVLHVTTNGSLPDRVERFVGDFEDRRRLRFLVSFDGLEAEHDASRGADVTFATACETVERLLAAGVQVSVNHTITSRQSLDDHDGLVRRFAARGVDVQMVLAYADSAMYGLRRRGQRAEDLVTATGYPLHPRLLGADVVGFVRRRLRDLPRLRDVGLRVAKRYYLRGLLQRLEHRPNPRPKPRCVALRSHLRLLPNGDVPVCQFNTEIVGNLLADDFDAVWHGTKARDSRQWVDACTGCWAECEVVPSALYTGDLVRGCL